MTLSPPAPELFVSEWLNTPEPLRIEALCGKIVLIKVFQMLCPGCASHALPQAMQVRRIFSEDDVAVLGLHSVFEHHEVQGTRAALAAFLHEYRITFPVGINDREGEARLPKTMLAYGMQGTPTTLIFDHQGTLRKQHFGIADDMAIGAEIASLIAEKRQSSPETADKMPPINCRDGVSLALAQS